MKAKNIRYESDQISQFYINNRRKWSQLYPSEQEVFAKIAENSTNIGDVLDIGCACGGLGHILTNKFGIKSYTGIDINDQAIQMAQRNKPKTRVEFISGDILSSRFKKKYDFTLSLSCADWNIETDTIIKKAWSLTKPGGFMVISLRLTTGKTTNDIKRSYQHINFNGEDKNPEVANYVVFNYKDSIHRFLKLSPRPEILGAYGYWGKPSLTAVTPHKRLAFTVFYLQKPKSGRTLTKCVLELPADLLFPEITAAENI